MTATPVALGVAQDGIVAHALGVALEGFTLGPVDLDVGPGRRHAVLGAAGSGKSLLLSILAGLTAPTRGTLAACGVDGARDPARYRRAIGFAFQRDALLVDESARENVARAARGRRIDAPDDAARDMLLRVGIAAADHERRPATLSGGMRRRVGLARALVVRPRVLLLDDPTAGLDPTTAREVLEVILDVVGRASLVLATHDVDLLLPAVPDVTVLERGRVVASGPWRDVLDDAHAVYRPRVHGGLA